MSPLRFLLTSAMAFILICVLYFLAVENVGIGGRDVEKYYKAFLLHASGDIENKIVIDAGSNASHAFRSYRVEKHFGRYTINIADKADYPLLHKIYRLIPYLKAGDLLVLPLEWNYYLRSGEVSENYVSLVLARDGSGYFYYAHLPLLERLRFVFRHVPFALALNRVLRLNAVKTFNPMLQLDALHDATEFAARVMAGDRGDFDLQTKNIFGLYAAKNQSCDDYLLEQFADETYALAPAFKGELRTIKRLAQESGVDIVFTWPTVVSREGERCYQSARAREQLPGLAAELHREISDAGLALIGTLAESQFDGDCFWDTYYHVNHVKEDCAPQRTRSLINDLETAGFQVRSDYDAGLASETLLDAARQRQALLSESMPPLDTPINAKAMETYISFFDGWGRPEEWGRWSIGRRSEFAIPAHGLKVSQVRITGNYFEGSENSEVWLNDRFLGHFDLQNKVIDIPVDMQGDLIFEIELRHPETPSPAEMGLSKDTREVKFGLTSLTLIST